MAWGVAGSRLIASLAGQPMSLRGSAHGALAGFVLCQTCSGWSVQKILVQRGSQRWGWGWQLLLEQGSRSLCLPQRSAVMVGMSRACLLLHLAPQTASASRQSHGCWSLFQITYKILQITSHMHQLQNLHKVKVLHQAPQRSISACCRF